MLLKEAQQILSIALAPISYDHFFDDIVGQKPLALNKNNSSELDKLLGIEPDNTILQDFAKYADTLTCHIANPQVPPPSARKASSPKDFSELVKEYHALGYTVRIPSVENISSQLSEFTRALEIIFSAPVGVVVFWSDAGAMAPVHYDEIDVIAIQLKGRKRWFVSQETSNCPNQWKGWGEGPPSLGVYNTYDVEPGDLLYIPRGTAHTVQSTSESIHLSIGFVPVTVRDTINAVLDNFSDLNKPIRSDAGIRADNLSTAANSHNLYEQVNRGIQKLNSEANSNEFIQQSLIKHRARMVFGLPKLSPFKGTPKVYLDSIINHHPLSISQLIETPEIIDLRLPGEQILIHLGAGNALRFILENPIFKVSDIPGDIQDDVRVALVQRLMVSGFLCFADKQEN